MTKDTLPKALRAFLSETPAFAYETITVSTVAKILTAATYADPDATKDAIADKALITIEDADIRVRTDGTAPTATEGHLIRQGATITLRNPVEIQNFQAIRDAGTDAVLKVSYS